MYSYSLCNCHSLFSTLRTPLSFSYMVDLLVINPHSFGLIAEACFIFEGQRWHILGYWLAVLSFSLECVMQIFPGLWGLAEESLDVLMGIPYMWPFNLSLLSLSFTFDNDMPQRRLWSCMNVGFWAYLKNWSFTRWLTIILGVLINSNSFQ